MKMLAAFAVMLVFSAVSTVAAIPDTACPHFVNNGAPTGDEVSLWQKLTNLFTVKPSIRNGR